MKTYDYIIVGAGLTGAVIARLLKEKGQKILILEKRNHIAGNLYDYTHNSNLLIQAYGPHYFRTNSQKIWNFLKNFTEFYPYAAKVKTLVDNKLEDWPVNKSYLDKLTESQKKDILKTDNPKNFEEMCLTKAPKLIYEKFIKNYTIKQWGINPRNLQAKLAQRFSVRNNYETKLTPNHKFQGLPKKGYTKMIKKMIEDIPIFTDYSFTISNISDFSWKKKLIYTGSIDQLFNSKFGKLKYRSQKRELIYYPNINLYQSNIQINNPDIKNGAYIRTLDWKHLPQNKDKKGTVITREYPFSPDNFDNLEYPFPDSENANLYLKYKTLLKNYDNIIVCGRLGDYKYYDMDIAIEKAFEVVSNLN